MAPRCPWSELSDALGQPNLKWCEAAQCSWITEPAWCNPDDHVLQGHAIWHAVSAAALYFVFRHYAALRPAGVASTRASLSA